ncbi:MAG: phosphonate ABC transporter, permease protein PhnE [Spirochaetia bacterium]|jgi:phosphonate transport system permease protein|nr:phosphonate ABC transporter, permease protein PhnE [Spirochaetia bacterium]
MTIAETYDAKPRSLVRQLLYICIAVVLLAWSASATSSAGTGSNGGKVALNILKGIINPERSILFNFTKTGVPYLLFETVCIAFLGTVVGAVISIPFAFLGAVNIVPKPVAFLVRVLVMAIRTIPSFVYGLMFIMVTGPGPFAGLLTMSFCSIGMVSKMYIETIEDVSPGIIEALDASGCNTFDKIRFGIFPQLFPSFASTFIYRFDMNLRDATVLGLVGAGGIGAPLLFAMSSYRWSEVGSILIGLIVLVLAVEYFSTYLRKKLARG